MGSVPADVTGPAVAQPVTIPNDLVPRGTQTTLEVYPNGPAENLTWPGQEVLPHLPLSVD